MRLHRQRLRRRDRPLFLEIGTPCDGSDSDLCLYGTWTCAPSTLSSQCVNENPTNVLEVCGGGDEDCDGDVDEPGAVGCVDYWYDADGDGYGIGVAVCLCTPQGYYTARDPGDCDDAEPASFPGNPEICDSIDNDCDLQVDEDPTGLPLTQSCYNGPPGTANVGSCIPGVQTCAGGAFGACLGEVLPSTELCNGLDDDCNGVDDPDVTGNSLTNPSHPCASDPNCQFGACYCFQSTQSGAWSCALD